MPCPEVGPRVPQVKELVLSMSVSPSTTLFTERLDMGQRPASFFFSMLLHGLTGVLIWWILIHSPRIDPRAAAEHLLVRSIELNAIEETRRSDSPERYYPAASSQASAAGSAPAQLRAALRKLHAEHGPQTIIQPDLTRHIALPEKVEIPQVILWSPSRVVVKKLVPPPPQKPAAAQVRPTIDLPTEEANLGDLSISSRPIASQKQMLLPSSSSPVAVEAPGKEQLVPMMQAQTNAQPTPAAVVSISDERMSGTATLPPVNESAGSDANGKFKPGDAASSSQPSNSSSKGVEGAGTAANGAEKAAGDGAAKIAGNGAGKTAGDAEKSASGNGASKPGALNHAGAATDGERGESLRQWIAARKLRRQ